MRLIYCSLILGTQLAWSQIPTRDSLPEELSVYSAEDAAALAAQHTEDEGHASSSPIIFDRAQILALGARTVFEVIDTVPGITVTKSVEGYLRAGIRGVRNDPEILFFLNDQPLNNLYQGRALAEIPVENIQRIEVWLGTGSAFANLGGFLATVKVFTHSPDALRIALGVVTPSSVDAHASTRLLADRWSLWLEGDAVRRTASSGDAGQFADVGARVAYALEGQGQLSLTLRYMNDARPPQLDEGIYFLPNSSRRWQVSMGQIQWQQPLMGTSFLRLRAYADTQSVSEASQFSDFSQLTAHSTQRIGGEFESLIVSNTQHFLIGMLAENQSLNQYSTANSNRPQGITSPQELGGGSVVSRLRLRFSAQDDWWMGRLAAIAFGFNLEGTQLPQLDSAGQIIGNRFQPYLNPRVALSLNPTASFTLQLKGARGVRYPTFAELADPYLGYSGFAPPVIDTAEVSGDLRFGMGTAAGRVHLTGFYQHFDRGLDPTAARQIFHVVGVEASAEISWKNEQRLWINSTWQRLADDSLQAPAARPVELPQFRVNAGASAPFFEWLGGDLLWRAGSSRNSLPGYSLVMAQVRSRQFLRPLEIYAGVQNLFSGGYADDAPINFTPSVVPRDGFQGFLRFRVVL